MAQHDLLKLASQGRAFDATRPWTEEELLALEALEAHGLVRTSAAEYVRNGITTVEAYEVAQAAGFEPKSLDALRADAVAAHQKEVRSQLGLPETEEVSETEEVAEPQVEVVSEETIETEEVSETEEVAEPEVVEEAKPEDKKSNTRGGKK